ncbi:MAG TPA: family 10 glycosylhydrolase [Kiritimatiellia bacterium]|nr:family 10 glycosylhydrolase [Kiritimatiellia bacterium]HMO97885.1 family 10 glycosylhydrolase [Kiritimatiellia bacterium]HMP95595.1 family 10 glycosylhydrolase [Kiritimatiellia bacterium]
MMRLCRIVLVGLGLAMSALGQVIDDFSYTSSLEAGSAWRAIDGPPPATPTSGGGLTLPIPFSDGRDRAYWDRDGKWDLAAPTGFKLEITCEKPSAMRALSIYFRSGKGWYIWSKPLPAAGRQKLILAKSDFKTEGAPAGWHKIDKIRISPWKGQTIDTTLILHRLAGYSDRVFVVQAGTSLTNASERTVATRTTERISRWLHQAGIPHAVVNEDKLVPSAATASVFVLPYNPKINPDGLKALRAMTGRGGKLMVFYSSDDQLAKLMDVKLGAATNTRDIARWRSMAFTGDAPPGVPSRVHQQSWAMGPAQPASAKATVIAWWSDAAGRRSDEPAVIAGPHGFWFTHILLADDNLAKQRMLTGLIAALDPSLWRDAADFARINAGRIDGWPDVETASTAITALAERHPDRETLTAFLRRIHGHHQAMNDRIAAGRYQDAVLKSYELTDLLIRTYGLAQRPLAGEFRGVWDHAATGWYPGDWERSARELAESGINAIFINATWAGLAHYESKHVPSSFTFGLYGDQLEQCIRAARKYGLQVHAWLVCWTLENSRVEFTTPLRKGDRLQHGVGGNKRLWMNPAHPDNVRHHLDLIREILDRYEVDGIHLDYIRYPDSGACFSPYTRRRFEEAAGRKVANWPKDVQSGGLHREAFVRWRADTVTDVVRQTRNLVKQQKPAVKLSAAVWGGYPQTIASIGQDWGQWMKEDLLDFIVPMNYANELYRFTALLDQQLPLPGVRGKMYPGIGVTANESQLRGDHVVEQILAARQRGIKGFVLYELTRTLADDTLPTLRMGVTRP